MSKREILNKYRVVVLKTPYELIGDKEAQDFFMNMCQLKIRGYGKEYPAGILPFDTSDFVANHVVLCEKQADDSLEPVMGFKSVSLATCDLFRITLPISNMVKSLDDTRSHSEYFDRLILETRDQGRGERLAYNGSFTVSPVQRADSFFHENLWNLGFYLVASHYLQEGIDQVVAICSTRFKVDKKKLDHGWAYIDYQGKTLGTFRCSALHDASFVPMQLNNVGEACVRDTELFPGLWENRIVLDKAAIGTKKVA